VVRAQALYLSGDFDNAIKVGPKKQPTRGGLPAAE
jgi:hypothetical protein